MKSGFCQDRMCVLDSAWAIIYYLCVVPQQNQKAKLKITKKKQVSSKWDKKWICWCFNAAVCHILSLWLGTERNPGTEAQTILRNKKIRKAKHLCVTTTIITGGWFLRTTQVLYPVMQTGCWSRHRARLPPFNCVYFQANGRNVNARKILPLALTTIDSSNIWKKLLQFICIMQSLIAHQCVTVAAPAALLLQQNDLCHAFQGGMFMKSTWRWILTG